MIPYLSGISLPSFSTGNLVFTSPPKATWSIVIDSFYQIVHIYHTSTVRPRYLKSSIIRSLDNDIAPMLCSELLEAFSETPKVYARVSSSFYRGPLEWVCQ